MYRVELKVTSGRNCKADRLIEAGSNYSDETRPAYGCGEKKKAGIRWFADYGRGLIFTKGKYIPPGRE